MTKLINKFQRGGVAYRASYSLPTVNIKSGRTSENFQKAQNARESDFYQNLIRRVAMNRATNIDYKWLRDNGITSDELNKDVAAHQLNVSNLIREQQYQKKINEEQQIKRIQNREGYEGLRKVMTAVPFMPVAPYLASGLGQSLVTAPVQTIGNFATGVLGGAAVNKATGGWGNMLGEKLGIPEASNILDYTNPGYFVGFPTKVIANVAGNLVDRLPSNMVDRLLPSRVAVTPEGIQIPVNSGNNRTMNFWKEVKGATKGAIEGWRNSKPKPKTPTSETIPNQSTRSNEVSYYDHNGDQIRLFDWIDPKEKYYKKIKNAYEKVPQNKEIYDQNTGNLIDINNAVPEGKYMYSDKTPAIVFKEVQNPLPGTEYYVEGYLDKQPVFEQYFPNPSSNLENVVTSKGAPTSNIFREITPKNANRYKVYINEKGYDVYDLYDSPLPQNRRQITPTGEELVSKADVNLYKAYKAQKDLSKAKNRKTLHQYTSQRLGTPLKGTVVDDPINQDVLEYVRRRGPWLPGNKYFNITLGGLLGSGAATRKIIGKGLNWWLTGPKPENNNQDSINNDTVSPYTLTEKDIEELSDTSAYDYQ